LNILIVGSGMYVTGRGTAGLGTVLPALAQISRTVAIEKVIIVATKAENATLVHGLTGRINALLGTSLQVEYRAIHRSLDETIQDLAIDCAVVCVPDHLHFEITDALMRRHIHCLIVKPLVPTVAQALSLLRLQEDMGLYCAVEFHKRFDEQNLLVRKLIRDGRLGRPLYMVVGYSQRIGIPLETFQNWASQTNIFQYLGVHYVDLIYFLTGMSPVRVSAVGTHGVLDGKGIKTWDSIHATIVWRQGTAGDEMVTQLAIGWVDPPATSALSDQRFLLVCSEGRMDLDQKDRGVTLVTADGGIETLNPYFSMILDDANGAATFQGYGFKSIQRYVLDVCDVMANRVSPGSLEATRPSLRQALVSTAVVEAVNQSLLQGGEWNEIYDST
jgi:D-galacturonate reductase